MILNDISTLNGLFQDLYFKGGFTSATLPRNDLLRIINIYYKIVQEDIRAVNEDFFMVSATTQLQLYSISSGTYSFPLDYEKVKSYWAALNPVNINAPLYTEYSRCMVIDANAITDPSYQFANPTIINFGSYFQLVPQLTDTTLYPVIKGMKMYYIQKQADLVNDTDTPNVFSDYHDVITWGALIDISQRLGKTDLKTQAEKMFNQRRAEMKADISARVLDIENSVVEGQTNEGAWQFPFGNGSQL